MPAPNEPAVIATPDIGARVAAQAELWIGTPFVWQGRIRGKGCDCKGLVAGVAAELGLPEAASVEAMSGDYGRVVPAGRLRAGMALLFDRVYDRQPGDVLLIKIDGKPQHMAIAAPHPARPNRVIETLGEVSNKVRPFRRDSASIDSIWRWRAVLVPAERGEP